MIARLIAGGVWFVSRVEVTGRLSLGRFAWRQRRHLLAASVAVSATAAMVAMVDALRLGPASGVAGYGLSAAIAGTLAVSPRLRLEALILVRTVASAVRAMLATVGAIAAAAVLFWDRLSVPSDWTLDETVARLRTDSAKIVADLLLLWFVGCVLRWAMFGFRHSQIRRASLFNRKMAACHEAAHALVATVLGLPLQAAWVLRDFDERGAGGGVILALPPTVAAPKPFYDLLARKVAVSVAGVAGARGNRPITDVLRELEHQYDWVQAKELSWIGASVRPDRVLLQDVLETVVFTLHTPSWTAAIATAAKVLLQAAGDPVPPETFATIARRFDLALPGVEALAGGAEEASNPPTQEMA